VHNVGIGNRHPQSAVDLLPMTRSLKHLLLWLLIAALPLQGLAVAMQTSCAGGQQGSAHETMHRHHGAFQLDATGLAGVDEHVHAHHHLDDDGDTSQYQTSSCSACASCCIGMTVLLAAGILPASQAGSELVTLAPKLVPAGFMPAGLERPPKHVFA
jgi:hypothetical protein